MKKMIGLLSALMITASSLMAQGKCPMMSSSCHGGSMKQGKGKEMRQALNLTDAQKTQMKAIRDEFKTKREALEKNDNITLKEYRSRQAAMQNEMKAKRQAVLTPQQKGIVDKRKLEMQAAREQKMQDRMKQMKTDLGLSDDQFKKVQANHEEMKSIIKAIRDDQSLSAQQKKEKMKQLHESGKGKMKDILTPEQSKKLDEMRKSKKEEGKMQHGGEHADKK